MSNLNVFDVGGEGSCTHESLKTKSSRSCKIYTVSITLHYLTCRCDFNSFLASGHFYPLLIVKHSKSKLVWHFIEAMQ